jgi:hypothetical protein
MSTGFKLMNSPQRTYATQDTLLSDLASLYCTKGGNPLLLADSFTYVEDENVAFFAYHVLP